MIQSPSPKTASGRHKKSGFIARRLGRMRALRQWGHTGRKGSVLLVVIGLLLLLMLISFTFFTFAAQENSSAEYYADAGKFFTIGLDIDALFDFGLEQLIIGPYEANTQSALWPGRHSLVPREIGMFGVNGQGVPQLADRHPHNGIGVNIISGPNGQPIVDSNYDGNNTTSDNAEHLRLNFSAAATIPAFGTALTRGAIFSAPADYPSIDAGYVYPDINSPFLAHISAAGDTYVVIPSFHRPQYLRDGSGVPVSDWYQNPGTVSRVMRPHPEHVCVANSSYKRFLSTAVNVTSPTPHTIQPFPFATDRTGTALNQGVWTNSAVTTVRYDVDNDGVGDPEGIWLDLGFPAQVLPLPDGRTYIPLFSYTVVDGDGLINLNTAGNLSGFAGISNLGTGLISRSNLGVSRTEINPFWGLTADPQSTASVSPADNPPGTNPLAGLQQHRGFFALSNQNPVQFGLNRLQVANMELMFLLWGRPKYNVTVSGGAESFAINDIFTGRWGESGNLLTAATTGWKGTPTLSPPSDPTLFPRPGQPNFDDDFDLRAGLGEVDPILGNSLLIPASGHPLDNFGGGSWLRQQGNEYVAMLSQDPANPSVPTRYLQYTGFHAGSQYQTAFSGIMSQNPAFEGQNFIPPSPATFGQFDEADETMVDTRYKTQLGGWDNIFEPSELAGLQLSDGDFRASLGSSRLRQLMPFNLELNLQAEAIRKRFTTESWDRQQHGFSKSPYPAATPRGNWEYGADWDLNGTANEFPPKVSVPNPSLQPFRPEVVAWIGARSDNISSTDQVFYQQLRLNINRLLTLPNPFGGINTSNAPTHRHLTPHPTSLNSLPIPGSAGSAQPAPTVFNPTAGPEYQEYWARADRQKLARDIYVMLYMFGGAQDGVNYASQSNKDPDGSGPMPRPLYLDWQLREMAQFAVNYVDALDRDDVMTLFEYDADLSDGWNLDDNPYMIDASSDRFTVFGVEAQTLTLSEALCIDAPAISPASDNSRTLYNDGTGGRTFTYIELRNAGATTVNLANGAFRVRMQRGVVTIPDYSLIPLFDGKNNTTTIPPNGQYTIGTSAVSTGTPDTFLDGAGNSVYRSSDFRIDLDGNGQFERIAPAISDDPGPASNQDVPPGCNLDLVHRRDDGRFQLIRHTGQTQLTLAPPLTGIDATGFRGEMGGFMPAGANPGAQAGALESMLFILERRANPNRNPASITDANQNADNPWVIVDVLQDTQGAIRPRARRIALQASDTGPMILANYLPTLFSTERARPLDRVITADGTGSNPPRWMNSIGAPLNSNVPALGANHYVWQPLFNRDFSSVIDLFDVPLYGPDEVTARLAFNGKLQGDLNYGYPLPQSQAPGNYQVNVAGAKFLQPLNAAFPNHNNRWHRILELLEFPSRVNSVLQNQSLSQLLRTPGKINLNTIRNREALYALLDDSLLINGSSPNDGNFENTRNWWNQFKAARDGYDPRTQLVIPGSPASRPFRDLSQATGALGGVGTQGVPANERTLLRRLTLDGEDINGNNALDPGEDVNLSGSLDGNNPNGVRRLFEARTATDMQPANNFVDPHTRNRLLTKVSNNSTSRSHVFIVWMTVGFFEAYQPDPTNYPNVYQIGQELDPTNPVRHRGFFVVDRSLMEGAYDSNSRTFDFRKFIQYRKTLE